MNRKPRILVIDDEEIARKNLQHVLSKENYDVLSVANGAAALRELESCRFDVVITDLKMQGVDGMDVLDRVTHECPHTAVIIVTGYATVNSAVLAMQKGAYFYIAKPFKLDEVRSKVREALGEIDKVRNQAEFPASGPIRHAEDAGGKGSGKGAKKEGRGGLPRMQ